MLLVNYIPQTGYIHPFSWTFAPAPAPPVLLGTGIVHTRNWGISSMLTVGTKTLRDLLQGLLLTGWTTGKLRLFKNDYLPAFDTVLADFVEADFDNYAEIDAVATPITGIDALTGNLVVVWPDGASWVVGTLAAEQTLYGWYIVNTGGTTCLAAGRFDTPVTVDEDGDVVSISPPKAQVPMAILV